MPIVKKNERIANELKQNKCKKINEFKSNLNIRFRKGFLENTFMEKFNKKKKNGVPHKQIIL